jgi:IclR family transcriptional regulator, KDG regulon repressor
MPEIVAASPASDEDDDEGAAAPSFLVHSVVMASEIIDALAAAPQPMRLTALANQLGETKAKIHRHLATLKHLGLVDQDRSTEWYKLGPKLVSLGQAATEQFELRRIAEPYMQTLRDLTGQTVVLSIPASGDAIITRVVEGPALVVIAVRMGYRLPAHASAQGRITLAFAPKAVQQRVLTRKLQAFTPLTTTDAGLLRERLARIRENLYEVAADETVHGISTLAAPVLDSRDELVGTIAIVGTTPQIDASSASAQLALVRGCAKAMSLKLHSKAYEASGVPVPSDFAPA